MTLTCPICGAAMESAGTGVLGQCESTLLPADVYRCPKCPETVTTVPNGEPYIADPVFLEYVEAKP